MNRARSLILVVSSSEMRKILEQATRERRLDAALSLGRIRPMDLRMKMISEGARRFRVRESQSPILARILGPIEEAA